MQQHCTELTQKLLKSIDKEYNVVDMGAVVDVLTALEKTTITKEVLESTRLGKHINNFRRQTTNDALAKRAKDLVRKWREMVLPSTNSSAPSAVSGVQTINGTKPQSPGTRLAAKPRSPVSMKSFKPQSPFLRDGTPSKVLSPALSLNSDQSRSPNPTPIKQQHPTSTIQNNRLNQTTSPILSSTSQNHSLDAVPRTHSSNKRLRKDEPSPPLPPPPPQQTQSPQSATTATTTTTTAITTQYDALSSSLTEHSVKKQRINGENININVNTNSKVPSPMQINTKLDVIVVADDSTIVASIGPKKRGRKKGSKSLKNQQLQQDRVKEKLASISRNPKLKTTQELLADLQARGSTITGAGTGNNNKTTSEPPTTEEILRVDDTTGFTNNHTKFINSTKSNDFENKRSDEDNKKNTINDKLCRHDPTVEEILAKLPPIDHDSIRWSDNEEDYHDTSTRNCEINDADVNRFHNNCVEGLNGNYQAKLNGSDDKIEDIKRINSGIHRCRDDNDDDKEFKEWHEMLARPSYDGQILHILPYVIID